MRKLLFAVGACAVLALPSLARAQAPAIQSAGGLGLSAVTAEISRSDLTIAGAGSSASNGWTAAVRSVARMDQYGSNGIGPNQYAATVNGSLSSLSSATGPNSLAASAGNTLGSAAQWVISGNNTTALSVPIGVAGASLSAPIGAR